jgi:hypothetical protein
MIWVRNKNFMLNVHIHPADSPVQNNQPQIGYDLKYFHKPQWFYQGNSFIIHDDDVGFRLLDLLNEGNLIGKKDAGNVETVHRVQQAFYASNQQGLRVK